MHFLCARCHLAGNVDGGAPEPYYRNLLAIERAGPTVEVTVHELPLEVVAPLEFRDGRRGQMSNADKDRIENELFHPVLALLLDTYSPRAILSRLRSQHTCTQPYMLLQPEMLSVLAHVL